MASSVLVMPGHSRHQPQGGLGAQEAAGHGAMDEFRLFLAQRGQAHANLFHDLGQQG